jgi:hypothetical protein
MKYSLLMRKIEVVAPGHTKREIHMNSCEEESGTLHLLQWALTWVYNGGLSTKSNNNFEVALVSPTRLSCINLRTYSAKVPLQHDRPNYLNNFTYRVHMNCYNLRNKEIHMKYYLQKQS